MEPNEIRGRYLYNTFLDDYSKIFNDPNGQFFSVDSLPPIQKNILPKDEKKMEELRKGFRSIDEQWEISIDEI